MSPLVRALLARELRPARVAAVGALVVTAAALLGRQLAGQTLPDGADLPPAIGAGAEFGAFLLARVGNLLAVPAGIAAAAGAVARVAGDHEDGWLPAVVAAGPPAVRARYLLGVVAAVVAASLLHWALASLAFGAGGGLGAARAMATMGRALPGVAAFVVSAAAYGTAWGALLRRRGAATAAAAGGVILPVAVLAAWRMAADGAAPHALAQLLALPIPPLAWDAAPVALARHALYALAVLLPLTLLAPRLVARTP